MSIINEIRATLDNRLLTTTGLPVVSAQNVKYVPTTGTPFLKTTLTPTLRRPAVRGLNPQQRYDGIYTILICTPEGSGAGGAFTTADLILNRFNATTDIFHPNYLTTSDVIVHVDFSELDNSFLDSPFFCTPVNVFWYTYHN